MAVNRKWRNAYLWMALDLVLAVAAASCGGSRRDAAQGSDSGGASSEATEPASADVDACALLTEAEVHALDSSLGPGRPSSVQIPNVSTCHWDKPSGMPALMLQISPADPSGLKAGLENGPATSGYRIEDVQGLDDSAAVAIQEADPASGITPMVALLEVKVGDRQLGLSPSGLGIRSTDDPAFHTLVQTAAAAIRRMKAGG